MSITDSNGHRKCKKLCLLLVDANYTVDHFVLLINMYIYGVRKSIGAIVKFVNLEITYFRIHGKLVSKVGKNYECIDMVTLKISVSGEGHIIILQIRKSVQSKTSQV